LPKSKPEELSAADLLVLLHEEEKKIGVPAAKEGGCCFLTTRTEMLMSFATAIDICFTLTDRFPSEVLAVVMQRIIDSVSLPILFMRTVCTAAINRHYGKR
jgi:symplekin